MGVAGGAKGVAQIRKLRSFAGAPLPLPIQNQKSAATAAEDSEPVSLFDAEKQIILKTIDKTGGNKSEAARRLGITRKTLVNKLSKYKEE